jgi:hypothetical protein
LQYAIPESAESLPWLDLFTNSSRTIKAGGVARHYRPKKGVLNNGTIQGTNLSSEGTIA